MHHVSILRSQESTILDAHAISYSSLFLGDDVGKDRRKTVSKYLGDDFKLEIFYRNWCVMVNGFNRFVIWNEN